MEADCDCRLYNSCILRLRRAIVEFDSWTNMSAKLMDLPTIVESHKSIDRKSFYKTADICQVMIITRTIFFWDAMVSFLLVLYAANISDAVVQRG